MLHIGNQTSCWTATPTEPFDYALAQHFDAFEWFPDKKPGVGWDESDLGSDVRESIRERASSRGMRLSVHTRWQADPFTDEGYVLIGQDVKLAHDLNAALFNLHLSHERGLEAFVQALLPLIQQTADVGLQLAIENTPLHTPEQFNELFSQLGALELPSTSHVGMCLDLGHANLCAATRNDYLKFCDLLSPEVPIIHLHLHENWGDTDSHLPLFTGPASRNDSGIRGLIARLKHRSFSGSVILEQWPQPPALLNQARDRLLQLWNLNGQEARSAPELISHPGTAAPATPGRLADFAGALVAADRRSRSWREKLDAVLALLADEQNVLTAEDLIDVAIYLRFLGTGEITCTEDGRHFRPASHARIAARIQERLARLSTPENEFVLRRIYPWLPSSSATFQRPEPLTRIRDIAHRNDIDAGLKREIKTALQNKLHRCAGPEDLVVASALLQRISAAGANYSPGFVEQFKLFHEELKEFFNAQSLDLRLEALKSSVGPEPQGLIELFLKQRTSRSVSEQLAALETLTSLREDFLLRAGAHPGPEAQDFVLADIALEDFAFVLLSEFINGCESANLETLLDLQSKALVLALRNLSLSGIEREESSAVEAELRNWGTPSKPPLRDELLRLKASVLRARRLAGAFAEKLVGLFSKHAEAIGPALGVAEHAVGVFSESDLRSHLVFQVAKLVSALLRRIRLVLRAPAWDVLVGGRSSGRVQFLESLVQKDGESGAMRVLLLEHAAGDEEIPPDVAAIVLAHEMPHLSHLGVRARQAGIVLVACEEPKEFERLRMSEGKMISLVALADKMTWETLGRSDLAVARKDRPSVQIPQVDVHPKSSWLPLDQAVSDNSGGKAAGARRLAELSRRGSAGFLVPASLVVPFGVMEGTLALVPEKEAEYRKLMGQLKGASAGTIASTARRLHSLVQDLPVPEAILSEVNRRFTPSTGLIVRSSANAEDLEELAGAGLYDSVVNVAPAEMAQAIRHVWSSLWTERATLSRHDSHIPHDEVHMAVLIQELCDADFSFVLHTTHPLTHNAREVYAEIVVGLGETLVSAASQGTPYRLVCGKDSGRVVTEAFANFSRASRPALDRGVRSETVDYTRIDLSRDAAAREDLARRLASIGSLVETALGKPQDIEGAIVRGQFYLVQSRPQQGLGTRREP